MYAAIAHAIMVGKYDLLAAEQSWDGGNYIVQNFEGVKIVIAFQPDRYICAIQNNNNAKGQCINNNAITNCYAGTDMAIKRLAEEEILPYMLINYDGAEIPFVSSSFWGNDGYNYSNQNEEYILNDAEGLINSFLSDAETSKLYWKEYYDMSKEQQELVEEIYQRRLAEKGIMHLNDSEKNKLHEWFESVTECVESFREMLIMYE